LQKNNAQHLNIKCSWNHSAENLSSVERAEWEQTIKSISFSSVEQLEFQFAECMSGEMFPEEILCGKCDCLDMNHLHNVN